MRSQRRQWQHGISLVEMMVVSVIGLFIVAATTRLFVAHLQAHRRVLLEARLHQDLRAAADLMARGLRRAGYWQGALESSRDAAIANPYRQIAFTNPALAQITYSYSRGEENDLVDGAEATGFRQSEDALQSLTGGIWQALTDSRTVQITRLAVTPDEQTVPLGHLCTPACVATDPACPRLRLRSYRIDITGRSASDPTMTRELHTTVRVRNDDIGSARCVAP